MKTVDSLITRWNADGEKVSISNRCAEMDREVSILGYSINPSHRSWLNILIFKYMHHLVNSLHTNSLIPEGIMAIFNSSLHIFCFALLWFSRC